MLVKRGIDLAVGAIVEHLSSRRAPRDSLEHLSRVAAISANDDESIGAIVAQTLHTVGDDGVISVDDGPVLGLRSTSSRTSSSTTATSRRTWSPTPAACSAVLDDPYLLFTAEKITDVRC